MNGETNKKNQQSQLDAFSDNKIIYCLDFDWGLQFFLEHPFYI